ncbi:MAG: hypothetical protein J5787_03655 [Alphaproteobacteria bacterium]|nr:hypothetical protein [Alphaproteobacteria bacterium]
MSAQEDFNKKSPDKEEEVQLFKIHGVNVHVTPSEKQFAQDLFDSLASIPTGRKAIEDMKKFKVDFFLETALGTAGGYFDPEKNQIVMAKSLGMDFMEFALVHEARHLLQNNQGRNEAEAQNLDYASRLMINRATEADAQTQAIKACKEWEAIGHDAPMKRFEQHYKPIVDAYNKRGSLSDAFKGWYDDDRIASSYEQGYDVDVYLNNLTAEPDYREPVSLTPADIAHFCGGDRVEGFEEFLDSKQARQVHLLTKTAVELYDEAAAAQGAPRDPSLKNVPVRDLKDNPAAQIYADKYIKKTREDIYPKLLDKETDPLEKRVSNTVMSAIKAVEKVNAAAIKGEHDVNAEKELKEAKARIGKDIKRFIPANETAKIAAIKNNRSR